MAPQAAGHVTHGEGVAVHAAPSLSRLAPAVCRRGVTGPTLVALLAVLFLWGGDALAAPLAYFTQTQTAGTPTLNAAARFAPIGVAVISAGATATVSWTAVGFTVNGYNVYRATIAGGPYTKVNGSLVSGLSFSDTGLSTGQYFYVVRLVNARGVESAANSAEVSVMVDVTAPTSTITAPTASQVIGGATCTVSGTAADNQAVQHVEVSVDGGSSWSIATGAASWTYAWTLPATGAYTVQARATDTAGNVQTVPTSVSVTVDRTAPAAPTITAPSGITITSFPTFTITGSNPVEGGLLMTVYRDKAPHGSLGAEDSVVTTVQLGAGVKSFSIPVDVTVELINSFAVTASDAVGNRSTPTYAPTIEYVLPGLSLSAAALAGERIGAPTVPTPPSMPAAMPSATSTARSVSPQPLATLAPTPTTTAPATRTPLPFRTLPAPTPLPFPMPTSTPISRRPPMVTVAPLTPTPVQPTVTPSSNRPTVTPAQPTVTPTPIRPTPAATMSVQPTSVPTVAPPTMAPPTMTPHPAVTVTRPPATTAPQATPIRQASIMPATPAATTRPLGR